MSTSSIIEGKKSCVINLVSGGNLKEVEESLSLSGERVDDVLLVVGDWSLEEEVQV
jgi:flavin reductase (DIM6/NTAB) family NADH-FMN oxidoreductase RutF